MMSISQVDMVVWRDQIGELQVCGDLDLRADERSAPPSTDPQSFTVVVRQGDSVAALHAARQAGGRLEGEAFDPGNGRWELRDSFATQGLFKVGQPAVVSVVIVLKQEPAGLETLSWVQPVKVEPDEPDEPLAGRAQLEFLPSEALARPTETDLGIGHSVSSSLALRQRDAAGGETYLARQRIDKLLPAIHHAP